MDITSRAVLTGAAGHLGSALAGALAENGFDVLGIDMVEPAEPLPAPVAFRRVDLLDVPALRRACEGADLIVHCASIHPWKPYSDAQYHDCNIKGTWNLYSAGAEAGVERVVLTSSIAAVGYHGVPVDAWPLTEEKQFPLGDLYSLTKHVQEDIAQMFAARDRIRTIALRPPPFMPRPPLQTGFALTGVFSLVGDMVSAHVAAARVLAGHQQASQPLAPFEAFFVMNRLPYRCADISLLEPNRNVRRLARKYWPDAFEWLVERGYEGVSLIALYDIGKAERLLGWRPAHNFDEWFERNRSIL